MQLLHVINSVVVESRSSDVANSETEGSFDTMVCLDGYIDGAGNLQTLTSETQASAPFVSRSIMKFAQAESTSKVITASSSSKSHLSCTKKKSKECPEEVQPMEILQILEKSNVGQDIVKFVKENKFIDLSHQIQMMRIIHEHVCAMHDYPLKYYPTSDMKLSIAKGIVKDLPELEDVGECKWASWLVIVNTKFATVQAGLPRDQRRNKKRSSSSSPSVSRPLKGPRSSASSTASSTSSGSGSLDTSTEVEVEDELASQKCMMRKLLPSTTNRHVISSALGSTFKSRRKWIMESGPSFTEVCGEYPHLINYDGDMIVEDFARIEPLCDERGILKFTHLVPAVLLYAQRKKPDLLKLIESKFPDVTIQALYFVQCSLPVTLNSSTATEEQLDHYRHFKHVIDTIPTSSLIQIAPENTCVDSYVSVEFSPDRPPTPLNPYLLWLTNDRNSGQLFLKIDKKSVPVGSGTSSMAERILKALTVLVFSHYVFHLNYHVYLKNFWNFLESLCGLGTPVTSVTRLRGALRQISEELK